MKGPTAEELAARHPLRTREIQPEILSDPMSLAHLPVADAKRVLRERLGVVEAGGHVVGLAGDPPERPESGVRELKTEFGGEHDQRRKKGF